MGPQEQHSKRERAAVGDERDETDGGRGLPEAKPEQHALGEPRPELEQGDGPGGAHGADEPGPDHEEPDRVADDVDTCSEEHACSELALEGVTQEYPVKGDFDDQGKQKG